MACTKLFLKGHMSARLFRVFDPDKTYKLTLTYKKLIPDSPCLYDSDFMDEYTKTVDRDEGHKILRAIDKGKCIECGHVSKCTMIKNKFFKGI